MLGWEPDGRASTTGCSGRSSESGRERLIGDDRLTAPLEPLRIAHLTATFPPYPGGAGQHLLTGSLAGQAERGHHVEVFTAAAEGEAARPRRGDRPPDRPGDGDRQRAADPEAGPARLLRRRPPPLPVHLRLRADAARPPPQAPPQRGADRPLQEPAARQGPARAAVRDLRAHGRAGADPRRRPDPRPQRRPRPLGLLPERGAREHARARDRDAERRRHRRPSRRAPTTTGLRERLGIPADAVVAAFVATLDRAHHFKRLDVAIEALARTRNRDIHLVVAGGGELLDGFRAQAAAAGVGGRVHFLDRVPHGELPVGAARLRPVRADDRAAGVVRDRPDRGDGVRAAGDRDRLPGRPRGRRRRDRHPDPAPATPRPPPRRSTGSSTSGPRAAARSEPPGRAKAERLWAWPALLDRMDEAYAEAIAARREKLGAAA